MKVLVTGSAGYVGTVLVAELQKRGHEVVGYDARQGQDIHDGHKLGQAMAGCAAVVHLAAIPHPHPGKRAEDYFYTNVTGTQAVAETAAGLGIPRLVYASSTAYYGAHRGFPFTPPRRGINESTPNAVQRYTGSKMPEPTPYNEAALAYACSKVAAETVLAAYGMARRLQVIILRMAPMIKDRTPYEWGLLLHVETAAAALADAVELGGQRWYEVYNVASAGSMSTKKWESRG